MANGLYTETIVKKKMTIGNQIARAALVALGAALILMGLLGGQTLFILFGMIVLVVFYFLLPSFKIDWEYIFCDGQIDFDRISGGEKRKTMLKIDMDNVEIMAPANSHELDSFNRRQGVTVKDFSSREKDANCYCIFINQGNQSYKIIFEPSEKMVDFAKQKAPRKVFKD